MTDTQGVKNHLPRRAKTNRPLLRMSQAIRPDNHLLFS
jgi:hypothetical protein